MVSHGALRHSEVEGREVTVPKALCGGEKSTGDRVCRVAVPSLTLSPMPLPSGHPEAQLSAPSQNIRPRCELGFFCPGP